MKYKLKGLDCAECANEIEEELNKLDIVDDAIVNFNTECLILKLKDNNKDNLDIIRKKLIELDNVTMIDYNNEFVDNYKFDLFKIIFSLILFIIGLLTNNEVLKIALFIISYVVIGYEIIMNAVTNVFKGKFFDENFLMTIATLGAFCIKEYSEAVAVMLFYSIGELLQTLIVNRSRKNISNLMNIKSDFANVVDGDNLVSTNIYKVKIGDIVVVKPGEKIPLDGVIIEGSSFLDTSCLTGESIPVRVKINDEVLSGSINQNEMLKIRVSKTYNDSTVSRIIEMVENATNKKSNSEKFITKFARIYTPIVVLISLLIGVIPPLVSDISFIDSIYKALVCLVISCPCALVISIPLSYFAGIGCASRHGILIKGSNFVDKLSNVGCLVFDKTGTLTKGVFEVINITSSNDFNEDDILKYAAYAEAYSNHPISNSILNKYNNKIDKSLIKNYKEIPGMGISASINNKKILVGNAKLLVDSHIEVVEGEFVGTVIYVGVDGKHAGSIVISDILKEETKDIVKLLKQMYIDSIILTGDNKKYAEEMCGDVGVDKIYSDLLPDGKVDKIEEIMRNYKKSVVFVGDGINDSPVLARSDVGIAMGGIGSDAAIEAADVVLMNDNLEKMIDAINISKKIKKVVISNIVMILLIKIIFLILGIIGIANIWQAVIADVGVTIFAIVNSMRCLRYKSVN